MEASPELEVYEPISRRGLCSAVYDGRMYIYGGYSNRLITFYFMPVEWQAKLDVFNFSTYQWDSIKTEGSYPNFTSGSGIIVVKDCLYLFGGWFRGERNADVHQLNFTNLNWTKLTDRDMKGGPMCKDKAGMIDYGDEMLCIFGGYGYGDFEFVNQKGASYHWDPTSHSEICWTNELHLFHINRREWISPEVTGKRPLPCAAFSFTRVDRHRAVLFGGRQLKERTDQLHILDMSSWHWSGLILPDGPNSPWPSKRSFHTACSLVDPNSVFYDKISHPSDLAATVINSWLPCPPPDLSNPNGTRIDPKLLVLWGMDNDSDPIDNAYILNVNTLTWEKVSLPVCAGSARIWHTAAAYHPAPHAATVLAVGGTNQNLYKHDETHIENVMRSSLIEFGMSKSLYTLCLDYIAGDLEGFSPMLWLLPGFLQDAIHCQHLTQNSRKRFYT